MWIHTLSIKHLLNNQRSTSVQVETLLIVYHYLHWIWVPVFRPAYIRASVDALYRDGTGEISRDPHTRMTHHGLKITSNSLQPISSYTYAPRPPKFPTREFALTRFFDFCVINHNLHLLLLQTRYLLTGSSWSVYFFTEHLPFCRRCARISSDRFFFARKSLRQIVELFHGSHWTTPFAANSASVSRMRRARVRCARITGWFTRLSQDACRGTLILQCLL